MINRDNRPCDLKLLKKMTDAMAFRGPDRQTTWQQGPVAFGHTLLRTTWEAATEQQPYSLDQQVWITGDIRLDRRKELRSQLESAGEVSDPDCPDVNLLLQAYHVWGDRCLDYLSGDFAFVIWDNRQQRLFCARDHFGIVPFYYAQIPNSLLISNTLNCLRMHPEVSDRLNEEAIADFLLFGMNHDFRTTTFQDIQKLPPAHSLTWCDGGVKIERYWQLPEHVEPLRYSQPQDYVEHFKGLFTQAVADRLRTNAAGTHLSGGMDSTSVAATTYQLMQASGRKVDFRGYTHVYERLIVDDEGDFAQQVAEKSGFTWEAIVADDLLIQNPSGYRPFPEPPMALYPNPYTDLYQRTQNFSRVVFSGFGGDPLFLFSYNHWHRLIKQGQWVQFSRELWQYIIRFRRPPGFGLRRYFRSRNTKPENLFQDWFNPAFAQRNHLEARLAEKFSQLQQYPQDIYGMTVSPLWSTIFAQADPGFIGFPQKTRFPFFDLHLVNYVLRIPRLPWFPNKLLLRESMRCILPDTVLKRAKTPLRGNPYAVYLEQHGIPTWMLTLAKSPQLSKYVKIENMVSRLETIQNTSSYYDYRQLEFMLTFSSWLCDISD